MRNSYKILIGKPGGRRPQGRPGHRCKNNIKMDLREGQDSDQLWAVVNMVMNLWAL
jgi:hypothetical protein